MSAPFGGALVGVFLGARVVEVVVVVVVVNGVVDFGIAGRSGISFAKFRCNESQPSLSVPVQVTVTRGSLYYGVCSLPSY